VERKGFSIKRTTFTEKQYRENHF